MYELKTVFENFMCGPLDVFEFDTINGLRFPDSLVFLAISNDVPHNGRLEDFFNYIESQAKKTGQVCAITNFLNDRFKNWILRRPGWHANDKIVYQKNVPFAKPVELPGVEFICD